MSISVGELSWSRHHACFVLCAWRASLVPLLLGDRLPFLSHAIRRPSNLQHYCLQVETDLPPKEEKTVLVKLSAAQQAVYKHLLINQDKKMVATVRAEAQRHDRAGGRRGEDGQSMSPGREGKNNEAKDSNDKDHRKLLDLLLQLRFV